MLPEPSGRPSSWQAVCFAPKAPLLPPSPRFPATPALLLGAVGEANAACECSSVCVPSGDAGKKQEGEL